MKFKPPEGLLRDLSITLSAGMLTEERGTEAMARILDRNGHIFDNKTLRCIHCGARYWECVAEAVKSKPN